MKYLKSYKLFESNWYDIKDHINVLSTMSMYLWDKELNVQVYDEIISREHQCVVVNITKRLGRFTFPVIKEELLEMVDYMDREGWEILNMEFNDPSSGYFYCYLKGDKLFTTYMNREITEEFEQLIVKFVEKEVKTNESTEEDIHRELMIQKYGLEAIEECDEVIRNIRDMALEVEDLGITVLVGYSTATKYTSAESTPKISVSVIADSILFAGKIADIDIFTDTLLGYVKSLGFSTGKNTFTTDQKITRQILIQK
jgi:hypothetical protein